MKSEADRHAERQARVARQAMTKCNQVCHAGYTSDTWVGKGGCAEREGGGGGGGGGV